MTTQAAADAQAINAPGWQGGGSPATASAGSFDDLVGADEHRGRACQAEPRGGLERLQLGLVAAGPTALDPDVSALHAAIPRGRQRTARL